MQNTYKEAAAIYNEMLQCWDRFNSGKNAAYNHATIVTLAIRLAKLGIKNPFGQLLNAGMVPNDEEPKEDKAYEHYEAKLDDAVEDEVAEAPVASEEIANNQNKKFGFKRR